MLKSTGQPATAVEIMIYMKYKLSKSALSLDISLSCVFHQETNHGLLAKQNKTWLTEQILEIENIEREEPIDTKKNQVLDFESKVLMCSINGIPYYNMLKLI